MATTKPRITLSLDPQLYQVLRLISGAGGQSMSGIISELLETALPTLEKMAETMLYLQRAKGVQREAVLKAMGEAEAVLAPLVQQAGASYDLFTSRVESAASGAGNRPRVAGTDSGARPRTPHTNRGVTPTGRKPQKPSNRKASRAISPSASQTKKRG